MERNLILKEIRDLSNSGNPDLEQFPFFDITHAVSENRQESKILGWDGHLTAIGKYIFMGKIVPDEISFAKEVANWQKKFGLKHDGIINYATWESMKVYIPRKSAGKVIAEWKGEYVSSLPPEQKNNLILILKELNKRIPNKYAKAAILAVTSKERSFMPFLEQSYKHTKAKRIRAVFAKRLAQKVKNGEITAAEMTDAFLENLAADDQKFFDFIYGAGGNKYRGRGFNQVTAQGNYKVIGNLIKVDLVNQPELLESREIAAKAVPAYFIYKLGTSTGKSLLQEQYNAKDGINSFNNLKDAVLACYHANAGIAHPYAKVWSFTKEKKDKLTMDDLVKMFPASTDKKVPSTRGKRMSLLRSTEFLKLIETLEEPEN